MREILMTMVVAFLVPARDDVPPPAKPLQEQFQGEWRLVSAVGDGRKENDEKVDGTTMTVKGDQILIKEAGRERTEDVTFTIDVAKKPAHIDIMPTKVKERIQGIFKIEGDVLTMCFGKGGMGARPTEFTSTPNSGLMLLHFRRAAK